MMSRRAKLEEKRKKEEEKRLREEEKVHCASDGHTLVFLSSGVCLPAAQCPLGHREPRGPMGTDGMWISSGGFSHAGLAPSAHKSNSDVLRLTGNQLWAGGSGRQTKIMLST